MKKRRFIWVLIVVAAILLVLVALIFTKFAKDNEKLEDAKADITMTLDSLLGRGKNKIYMKGVSSLYFSSNSIFQGDGVGAIAATEVQYKIKDIDLDGNYGNVLISITSPDIIPIFQDIISNGEVEGETELLEGFTSALQSEYSTIEMNVECDLELTNRRWVIVPNEDLYDALSGGLYSYVTDSALKTANDLYGGEADE